MSTPINITEGTALAGGAIAANLLETLMNKGILTLDECLSILNGALDNVSIAKGAPAGDGAAMFLSILIAEKFPARNHHK